MSHDTLQAALDDLDAATTKRLDADAATIAHLRKVILRALLAIADQYDGAPDSPTRWLGETLAELREAINTKGSDR